MGENLKSKLIAPLTAGNVLKKTNMEILSVAAKKSETTSKINFKTLSAKTYSRNVREMQTRTLKLPILKRTSNLSRVLLP